MNAHPPEDEQGIEVEGIARLLPAPSVPELSDDRLRELRGSIREEIRISSPAPPPSSTHRGGGGPRCGRRSSIRRAQHRIHGRRVGHQFWRDGKVVTDTSFGGNGKVVTNLTRRDDAGFCSGDPGRRQDRPRRETAGRALQQRRDARHELQRRRQGDDRLLRRPGWPSRRTARSSSSAPGSRAALGLPEFALARYNSDGTLDATFGVNGKVMTDFTARWRLAPPGWPSRRTAGSSSSASPGSGVDTNPVFALARYNSDGTLDASFGVDGKVMTDFTAWRRLQPAGWPSRRTAGSSLSAVQPGSRSSPSPATTATAPSTRASASTAR